jgi:hypothetical protein
MVSTDEVSVVKSTTTSEGALEVDADADDGCAKEGGGEVVIIDRNAKKEVIPTQSQEESSNKI